LVEDVPRHGLGRRICSRQLCNFVEIAIVQWLEHRAQLRAKPADVVECSGGIDVACVSPDLDPVCVPVETSRRTEVAAQRVRRLELGCNAYFKYLHRASRNNPEQPV